MIETRQGASTVISTCISLQSSGKECHVVSDIKLSEGYPSTFATRLIRGCCMLKQSYRD